MKRGFSYAEAIEYVGVRRRTFDARWRPHLTAMQQGNCVVFDRTELDELFDRFKTEASAVAHERQPDDFRIQPQHNGPRNGRPVIEKGVSEWAERLPGSTPAKKEPGKLTSGGAALDFASAASAVLRKRKAG